MIRRERRPEAAYTRSILAPGAAAGVVAAVVMGLFWMILSAAQAQGFFTPLKLIGAFWFAGAAMEYDLAATVVGLLSHLAVGAVLGIVFAALVRNVRSPSKLIAAGLAYGAAVYALMTYAALPWANPIMFAAVDRGWFFIVHLAFGLTLPLALPVRHAMLSEHGFRDHAYSRP